MTKDYIKETVNFTIDGRSATAPLHEPLIRTARRLGIDIPSLCDHKALLPYGACRLCLVEVTGGGRSRLVTACTYPAEEGIGVKTWTEEIGQHRRLIAEILLSRSGKAPVIRELAAKMGIARSRFGSADETCILCGLCTRVCETYATSAISTLHRGEKKEIGPPGDSPVDCVGCGACSQICPTGHITFDRLESTHTIWNREFQIPVAVVDKTLCHQCGACAAACPFSIPRSVLKREGLSFTEIDFSACRGCGVCVATCPSGAITQPRFSPEEKAPKNDINSVWILGCGRTNLGGNHPASLPSGFSFTQVPCVGSITVDLLLNGLARGFSRIMVLGRHQETCYLNGAEENARKITERADSLAELLGLGRARIAFGELPPGNDRTLEFIREFAKTAEPNPFKSAPGQHGPSLEGDGPFRTLTWFSRHKELEPAGEGWLARHGLPKAEPGQPVLLSGDIPYLDTLFGEIFKPYSLAAVLKDCLAVLGQLGIPATGIWIDAAGREKTSIGDAHRTSALYSTAATDQGGQITPITDLLLERIDTIKGEPKDRYAAFYKKNNGHALLIEALGYKPIPVDDIPEIDASKTLSPAMKCTLLDRLIQARDGGAEFLIVSDPKELAWHYLANRKGSWQRSLVQPMLLSSLAAATFSEER